MAHPMCQSDIFARDYGWMALLGPTPFCASAKISYALGLRK